MSLFDVLVDPSRRQILDLLRERERSVGELVGALGMSQPGVSKHLRVLRDAGLVSVRVDAQRRVYGLDPKPLVEVDMWLAPYRRYWADRLDDLERVAWTRKPAAVCSSAGKNDSIASSETVTSTAVPNVVRVLRNLSPSISSGTNTSCAAGWSVRAGIALELLVELVEVALVRAPRGRAAGAPATRRGS